jgi:hypothetical protein
MLNPGDVERSSCDMFYSNVAAFTCKENLGRSHSG